MKYLLILLLFTGCSANPVPVFQLAEAVINEVPRFSFWSKDNRTFVIINKCKANDEKDNADNTTPND